QGFEAQAEEAWHAGGRGAGDPSPRRPSSFRPRLIPLLGSRGRHQPVPPQRFEQVKHADEGGYRPPWTSPASSSVRSWIVSLLSSRASTCLSACLGFLSSVMLASSYREYPALASRRCIRERRIIVTGSGVSPECPRRHAEPEGRAGGRRGEFGAQGAVRRSPVNCSLVGVGAGGV